MQTIKRKRITIKGVKPKGKAQNEFKNFYIYGAINPFTGDSFFYEFNTLDGKCFEAFLKEVSEEFKDSFNIIILDNATAHKSSSINIPNNISLLFQPPYTPELNPTERLWQYIKDKIAWHIFNKLDDLRDFVYQIINTLTLDEITSISQYPYIIALNENDVFSSLCN